MNVPCKPRPQGGDYRPHYRKDEVDRYTASLQENYRLALDRKRLWLEVIDHLMGAIASDSRVKISKAYNEAASKIAAARKTRNK